MKYICGKTLTALDKLDYHRKSRLFIFLYGTDLRNQEVDGRFH
jgi:hypothetical protein